MRRRPSFFAAANGGDAVAVFEEVARHLLDCDGSFPPRTTGSCRSRLDQLVAALNKDDLQLPFSELVEVLATALPALGPSSSTRAARRPRRGGGGGAPEACYSPRTRRGCNRPRTKVRCTWLLFFASPWAWSRWRTKAHVAANSIHVESAHRHLMHPSRGAGQMEKKVK
jgi:hypothetical protein